MCSICSCRCCFIFFNAIFLASGGALIAIGAVQYSTYSQVGAFIESSLSKMALVLIAVGVTIVGTSILGHIGAFTKNSSMMSCFICLIFVIITVEILTGIGLYVFRSRAALIELNIGINIKARTAITEYAEKNRKAINKIQEKFRCCGADSYKDWSGSVGWENRDALPDSCCVDNSAGGCGKDETKIHTKGCISAIKLFLMKNILWVGAVCIALGVLEVLGLLFAVCLCVDIKLNHYEDL